MDAETKPEDESDTKTAETQRKMNLQPRVPQLVSMVRSWNREHFRHFPCHLTDPAAARADRSKLLYNLLSNKRIIEGKVTIGETGLRLLYFHQKIPSISAAMLEMFAEPAGELVTAVTITAVL